MENTLKRGLHKNIEVSEWAKPTDMLVSAGLDILIKIVLAYAA